MRALSYVLLTISALSMPLAAAAQEDLSVEELLQLFEQQKQVFSEAENNGLGRTRGLTLVTVADAVAEPVAAADATGASVTAAAEPGAQAAADPNAPLVFGQLAPELQVNLQIKFDFDSAALSNDEKPKLDKMCTVLQQSSVNLFRIVGHTDTSGSEEYNERLSILRAKEVARHLTEQCGIDASRLQTIGMGERFPLNTADPRADENRRVEFQALS